MGYFSALDTEIHDFESRLHADAGHLVDEFRALIGKLTGQAEADAVDIAHQAAPVVAAAEADAAALASEAAAGAEGIVNPPKPGA